MPHPQHKLIVNDSGINEFDIMNMRWIITCAHPGIYYCDIPNLLNLSFVVKYVDN